MYCRPSNTMSLGICSLRRAEADDKLTGGSRSAGSKLYSPVDSGGMSGHFLISAMRVISQRLGLSQIRVGLTKPILMNFKLYELDCGQPT
jgi:hypothetical protein